MADPTRPYRPGAFGWNNRSVQATVTTQTQTSQPPGNATGSLGSSGATQNHVQPAAPPHTNQTNWQGPFQHVGRDSHAYNRDPTSNAPAYRRLFHRYPNLNPPPSWDNRPTYTEPAHNWYTFSLGEVISRPFHDSNTSSTERRIRPTDTKLQLENNPITETRLYNHLAIKGDRTFSHVFSKRRMFVIISKFEDTMFCLPLYSHQETGFSNIETYRYHENVGLRDSMQRMDFISRGVLAPIDFDGWAPTKDEALHITCSIDMARGVSVAWWEEGLEIVGRVTKKGYDRLMGHYDALVQRARTLEVTTMWPPPRDNWVEPQFIPEVI